MTKRYLRYKHVKQRLILNSCTWQHQWERLLLYTNHSTAQLTENWKNSQVSYHIQMCNVQT